MRNAHQTDSRSGRSNLWPSDCRGDGSAPGPPRWLPGTDKPAASLVATTRRRWEAWAVGEARPWRDRPATGGGTLPGGPWPRTQRHPTGRIYAPCSALHRAACARGLETPNRRICALCSALYGRTRAPVLSTSPGGPVPSAERTATARRTPWINHRSPAGPRTERAVHPTTGKPALWVRPRPATSRSPAPARPGPGPPVVPRPPAAHPPRPWEDAFVREGDRRAKASRREHHRRATGAPQAGRRARRAPGGPW